MSAEHFYLRRGLYTNSMCIYLADWGGRAVSKVLKTFSPLQTFWETWFGLNMSARHLNSDKIPKLEATANTSNCGFIDGKGPGLCNPSWGREHAKPWYSSKFVYFVHIGGFPCVSGSVAMEFTVAIRTWISVTEVAEVLPRCSSALLPFWSCLLSCKC